MIAGVSPVRHANGFVDKTAKVRRSRRWWRLASAVPWRVAANGAPVGAQDRLPSTWLFGPSTHWGCSRTGPEAGHSSSANSRGVRLMRGPLLKWCSERGRQLCDVVLRGPSTRDDDDTVLGGVQSLRFAPALLAPAADWTQPARGVIWHLSSKPISVANRAPSLLGPDW